MSKKVEIKSQLEKLKGTLKETSVGFKLNTDFLSTVDTRVLFNLLSDDSVAVFLKRSGTGLVVFILIQE